MLSTLVNVIVLLLLLFNLNNCVANKNEIKTERFYRHYFMVMAVLFSLDSALSWILYRIPYYQFFKLLTFAVLSKPNGQGPYFIYNVYFAQIHLIFDQYIKFMHKLSINTFNQLQKKYTRIASITTIIDETIISNFRKYKNYFERIMYKPESEIVPLQQESGSVSQETASMELSKPSFLENDGCSLSESDEVCIKSKKIISTKGNEENISVDEHITF